MGEVSWQPAAQKGGVQPAYWQAVGYLMQGPDRNSAETSSHIQPDTPTPSLRMQHLTCNAPSSHGLQRGEAARRPRVRQAAADVQTVKLQML